MLKNIAIVNNTGLDIRGFEVAIKNAIEETGALPEEIADLFTLTRLDGLNPDGSPSFALDNA